MEESSCTEPDSDGVFVALLLNRPMSQTSSLVVELNATLPWFAVTLEEIAFLGSGTTTWTSSKMFPSGDLLLAIICTLQLPLSQVICGRQYICGTGTLPMR